MNPVIVRGRVDADGVLRLTVPIGKEEADREVQVLVEPLKPKKQMTQEEWAAWVQSMAGTWQGDFERPPQLPLAERESF